MVLGADPLDDRIGVPDSAAWQALFGAALPVVAGEYVDHGAKTVVSYEAADLDALVADLYGSMAAAADGDLPTVTDVLGTAGWDGLVSDVGRIDERRHFDPETGLRVTQRLFDEYREHRLQRLEGRAALLARAELFHTPPSRQDDVVARARDDDARIDATWRQHAKTALPTPDELAARLDFHRIVGAMSSYPTVLRRLGLVVDLVLPRDAFADSADAALSVEVDVRGRRADRAAARPTSRPSSTPHCQPPASPPCRTRPRAPMTRASPTVCSSSIQAASRCCRRTSTAPASSCSTSHGRSRASPPATRAWTPSRAPSAGSACPRCERPG